MSRPVYLYDTAPREAYTGMLSYRGMQVRTPILVGVLYGVQILSLLVHMEYISSPGVFPPMDIPGSGLVY